MTLSSEEKKMGTCPTCGSSLHIARRQSHCVMMCPPVNWKWVTDERLSATDQIECSDPWHDAKPLPVEAPEQPRQGARTFWKEWANMQVFQDSILHRHVEIAAAFAEAYAASRLDSAIKMVRDKRDSCSEWTDEYKAWQAVIDVMEGK